MSAPFALRLAFGRLYRLVRPLPHPRNADGRVLVNLGCGRSNDARFVNVDGYPRHHVHHIHRIDRLPFFADASVDLLYASHCLEHFSYRDTARVLAEWVRVLRPGGRLRLAVPDFDALAGVAARGGELETILGPLLGGQENAYNVHFAAFNRASLTRALLAAGLRDVAPWSPDALSDFPDASRASVMLGAESVPVSLNLEAFR